MIPIPRCTALLITFVALLVFAGTAQCKSLPESEGITSENVYGFLSTQRIEQQLLPLLNEQHNKELSETRQNELSKKIDRLIGRVKNPSELQKLIYWNYCTYADYLDIGVLDSALRRLYPPHSEMVYDIASLIHADAGPSEIISSVLMEDPEPWSEKSCPKHPEPRMLHPGVRVLITANMHTWTLYPIRAMNSQEAAVYFNVTLKLRHRAKPDTCGEATFTLDRYGRPDKITGSTTLKNVILSAAPFGPLPPGLSHAYVKVDFN